MSDKIETNKIDWMYDLEIYPNCFTFSIVKSDRSVKRVFEVSSRKNDIEGIFKCLDYFHDNYDNHRMVGFNNLGFDYPILHKLIGLRSKDNLPSKGSGLAKRLYMFAQEQIDGFKDGGFGNTVKEDEWFVDQLDLYKVHHFDNKARATSLKMLEFNMKSDSIEDLPFPVGKELTDEQIDLLIKYNLHDVEKTIDFYHHSLESIRFREVLSTKYGRNFMNHNDTKIGKDYFIMRLEEEGIPCYSINVDSRGFSKRSINQTKREFINVKDCLFDYYNFETEQFKAVLDWFSKQRISETKGVFSDILEHELGEVAKYAVLEEKRKKFKFKPTERDIAEFKEMYPLGWIVEEPLKAMVPLLDEFGNFVMEYPLDENGKPDTTKKQRKVKTPKISYWMHWKEATNLNVVIDGFRFDFGTGGIHGSIESKVARSTSSYDIIDADVTSMYPSIAIANNVYPLHLTTKFCEIYKDVFEQRISYPKGSPENAMLKLALNGVYGDSNNKFSPFYDPQYTMSITINGQLSLCLLAEKLLKIEGLKIIQANTDGITVACRKDKRDEYFEVCKEWEKRVGLNLEFVDYSKMIIRDVNNYISVSTSGKVKRKGAYQYEQLGWHQNQGGLVIPKAAEAFMLHGVDIRDFIKKHNNLWDFMLVTKVPRSSKLVLVTNDIDIQQQNICRYYVSPTGGKLVKVMPPLEGDTEFRRIGICTEWSIKTCNNISDFKWDIDYEYYVSEAEKLVVR